jgi:hypothetical protein
MVARYLKAVGDPREVVSDPEARYFGGRVEEHSKPITSTAGEVHLRRILKKYATYYNELRTHRSLNKDAPIHRGLQHVGRIVSAPILGGLHHHYCRI